MAVIPLYKPWWIHTTDPLSIDEEPSNIYADENLLSLDDMGSQISEDMPKLWDLAGNYDVARAKIVTGSDGKEQVDPGPEWTDEYKEFLKVPANKAIYLLDE